MNDSAGSSKQGESNARLLVGVGASRASLDTIDDLLRQLPAGRGLTIVLCTVEGGLDIERLAPASALPVVEAAEGMHLEPDVVYVVPAQCVAEVSSGAFVLEAIGGRSPEPPVDRLMRSLAREYGARAAGVLLSGPGEDGAVGLRAVREAGGLAIAQEPDEARDPEMPRNALAAGILDLVLPVREVSAALGRCSTPPSSLHGATPGKLPYGTLARLGAVVEEKTNLNLEAYKPATVRRRLERRMRLSGHLSLEAYLSYIAQDEDEPRRFARDLLIGVTSFFRDEEAFEELAETTVRPLVRQVAPGTKLRAWVAGCATGQEAYSIAMLFLEAIESCGKDLDLQVFATDIDLDAIALARCGEYPNGIVAELGQMRVERWFSQGESGFLRVRPELREVVSFAGHDLYSDAPFSGMHLVSSRNLLIYLRREAQEQVLNAFHYALQDGGVLFLGPSEAPSLRSKLFTALSKKWSLYRKAVSASPVASRRPHRSGSTRFFALGPIARRDDISEIARRSLLDSCVPPSVVVSADDSIVLSHGDLKPYLRLPQGEPTFHLWPCLEHGLASRVRSTLARARRRGAPVTAVARTETGQQVRLVAIPAKGMGEGSVVLTFEMLAAPEGGVELQSPVDASLVEELERELGATREDLRISIEQLESTNQELIDAHEEARSMNEELQSSNEELEASSEELRSLNERLSTVNAHLFEKVEQLEQANDDLSNFVASTKIATLFFDGDLLLKRFTPASAALAGIGDSDLGRPLTELRFSCARLRSELERDAVEVLATLAPRERELHLEDHRWLLRRVLPYRTQDSRIGGVVVTLQDITDLKRAAARISSHAERQEVIARLALRALQEPDLAMLLDDTVREVQQVLGTDFTKILELQPKDEKLILRSGVGWRPGLVGETWVDAGLSSQAGYTLRAPGPVVVDDLATEQRFSGAPLIRDHGVTSGVSVVISEGARPYGVLSVHTCERRVFEPEEVNFLVTVSALLTAAVTRHQARVQLELESRLSLPLATAESKESIVSAVLETCSATLGADVGEFWELAEGGEVFVCRTLRVQGGLDAARVRRSFSDCTFKVSEGIIGRTFQSGQAAWAGRLEEAEVFRRMEGAEALGLSTGLAFALRAGDEVVGVFALFARRSLIAEHAYLQSLEAVGRTAGGCLRRVEAERAVREQEVKAGTILDACRDAVIAMDQYGRVSGLNHAAEELFLCRRDEVVGQDMATLFIPDDQRERHREAFAEHVRTGRGTLFGERLLLTARRSNNTEFPCEVTITRAEGEDGPTFVGFIRDISARLAAERALSESEARFRQIFEHSGVSLWEEDFTEVWRFFEDLRSEGVDDLGAYCRENPGFVARCASAIRVLDVNQESVRLFEAETKAELKRSLPQTFLPESYDVLAEELATFARGRRTFSSETLVQTLKGKRMFVTFAVRVAPRDQDGRVRAVASVMDVSRRRRLEERLREASRQKDEFMAMLGHELRNPLAAIRSSADIVAREACSETDRRLAQEIIDRQSRHMGILLDGLLDISRIASGKIAMQPQTVDLGALLRDVLNDAQARSNAKGLSVTTEVPDSPVWVEGDRVRLTQIIDNLLTNATKYTPAGGEVHLSLSTAGDRVDLEVRDTGIGIAADDLPHVFEIFRQGGGRPEAENGGLGVGLALVRALVDMHGGTIVAESEGLGRGCRFAVELPAAEAPRSREESARSSSGSSPRRLLLVEDNEDAAASLRILLEGNGHTVELAADGKEAIERARAFRPEVVVCDIGLPGDMLGYDVARALRADPDLAGAVLVAVTGYGQREDRERCHAAGFDAHLTKPVDFEALERLVAEGRSPAPPQG